MVVFPDGVRVFRGKPGSRHQLPDFVKLTDTKRMASSDRKLVARIVIGQNPAWSFETGQPSKLAKSAQDVDETGSTRKAGRGRQPGRNTVAPLPGFVMGARFGFECGLKAVSPFT